MREYVRGVEAAARAKLHPDYLKKLRCVGGGPPFIKAGRAVLYDVEDLDTWLSARKVSNTSEGAALKVEAV